MRLRNNPEALDYLLSQEGLVYINPTDVKGKWHEIFGNDNPIFIEIGMGKGDFILENAKRYPDKNFIGIEKYSTVLTIAVKKAKNDEIPSNLRYLKEDAVRLNEVFDDEEIDGIFLNFSDPWPKKRHTKRRLTYKSFLDVYKKLIKDQGHLVFQTDNRGLFEYSLSSFANYGLTFEDICLDLHHSEGYDDNIQTEYEEDGTMLKQMFKNHSEKKAVNRIEKNFDKEKDSSERYLIVSDNYSLLKDLQLIEKISLEQKQSLYSVGIPAAFAIFLFDLVTIVINRLTLISQVIFPKSK